MTDHLGREPMSGEFIALEITSVSVTPESEEAGTIFTMRAQLHDLADIGSVAARLYFDEDLVDAFYLYDDGLHGDDEAGDMLFANTWDSTGKPPGMYDLGITAANEFGQEATASEEGAVEIIEGTCIPMKHEGDQHDRLDIVFVPCDYSPGEDGKFRDDSQAHMDELLAFPPFDEYPDKVNVYRVNRLGEVDCYYNGRCVLAPGSEVRQLAGECGAYDKIIVLADSTQWAGCAYLGGVAHASSRYPWITVHEFGHSFGSLLDEYSYGPSGGTDGPNCDYAGCARWADVPGTGCYAGCMYDSLYRPTADSTMRSALHPDFGPVNLGVLRGILDGYS